MNLVGAEVRRFWARRAVGVVLLLTTVLVSLLIGSAVWSTRPASAEELTAARNQVEAMDDSWKADYAACQEDPREFFGPQADEADCEDLRPQVEWFLGR